MEELIKQYETVSTEHVKVWFKAGHIKDFQAIEAVVLNTRTNKLQFSILKEEMHGMLAKMLVLTKWKWSYREE